MRALLVAVGFLTRMPVPAAAFADARAQSRSLAWYPLVGLLLGLVLLALAWTLRSTPPLLSAALLLVAWTWATGALHLDGLADSADAWAGGHAATPAQTRERTLAIMKDPRCGPMGVVALGAVLLLKFAALASLSPAALMWLPLAPLLGRAALTLAFIGTPYVRREGLGSALVAAPRWSCAVALVGVAMVCATQGVAGALAAGTALLLFLAWRRACMARLGGMTGDTAGALAELTESAVLVVLVLAGD
jgi:adenosylcobinamide-GDP ribazoletransferase